MKPLLKAFFTITLCFVTSFAFSQEEQDDKEDAKNLRSGSIIVTGKKTETGTVSVIDGSAVKETTKTDAINLISEKVPSFHNGNNRIMGFGLSASGAAAMTIRGAGLSVAGPSTGLPILINGLDAGMMVNNHQIADIFSMKNIDRIEVLLGPQPVLYGDSALAGVINIITKRRETDGFNTEIGGSYGSWNTTDDYVMHNGKISAFDYGFSYNFRYTDGARKQTINTPTRGNVEFDSRYKSHNGTFQLGYEVNKNWYTAVSGYLMNMDIHDPGGKGYGTAAATTRDNLEYFDVTRGGGTLSINNNYNKLTGSLQVYYNMGKHEAYRPGRVAPERDTYDSFDQMFGAKLKEKISFDTGTSITGGAEYRRHGGRAKNRALTGGRVYIDNEYIDEGSGFALAEQSLFNDIWIISAGGRYTHHSESGNLGSWQAGTLVNPLRGTKLHFQSARGFKSPGIMQYYNTMISNAPTMIESGKNLKTETYTSFEAGAEQNLFDIATVSVTGYRIYTDNRIYFQFGAPPLPMWFNGDKFNYNGVESSIDVKPVKQLTLTGGYSWIDIRGGNSWNDIRADGKKLLVNVPKHKAIGAVKFEIADFMIVLNGQYVKDIYQSASSKLDNFFVLNSKIAYTFLENYRVFVDFNNITDKEYVAFRNGVYDYPMPGFNWRAGASASF
ncbi:MAG: TonB-dependent receptor [Spirochaetes bacterium]|nr:TonB-dependent receptor [Spirochaetota bacterium]